MAPAGGLPVWIAGLVAVAQGSDGGRWFLRALLPSGDQDRKEDSPLSVLMAGSGKSALDLVAPMLQKKPCQQLGFAYHLGNWENGRVRPVVILGQAPFLGPH